MSVRPLTPEIRYGGKRTMKAQPFLRAACVCAAIIAVCLAHLQLTWAAEPGGELKGKRPNIVLVLTDDQGYGDLSCHGNPILKTPNLDRLHREGVRLTEFHVSPTCAPTRCSIFTGRHEFKSGVTHTIYERERMSLKAVTFAQLLRQAGYATGIFGKWHLGDEPDRWPDKRGFEEMFIHGGGGIGQSYPGTCGDSPRNTYFSPMILHNGRFEKTDGYCTDVFFRQALEWIAAVKQRGPFLAYIATNAPHAPLNVPEKYAQLYADKVTEKEAKFFGMIANIDENVGRLLARLEQMGIERETLVVFMNDNGGTAGVKVWNAGLHGGKGAPWQGGTRGASFWRWPGTLKPADVGALTAHIDLYRTFCELAGATIPAAAAAKLEGRSLLPLLTNPQAAWPDRYLVTHLGRWPHGEAAAAKLRQCSIRNSRYSLVSASKRRGVPPHWELFDLQADPGEATDIAAGHPQIVTELRTAYDQWWQETLPCLENENVPVPAENPFKTLFLKQFGQRP